MSVASSKTQPRVTSSDSLFSFVLGAWSLWNLFPVLGAWSAKSARISFSRSFVKCVVNLSGWNILSQSHYIGSFKMHQVIQPANTSRCMFAMRNLTTKPRTARGGHEKIEAEPYPAFAQAEHRHCIEAQNKLSNNHAQDELWVSMLVLPLRTYCHEEPYSLCQ